MVDAKSLYDAVRKEAPVQGAACKRTAIEMLGLRQSMMSFGAVLRWVSSERQLSDGLTKVAARQLLADRLMAQTYRLVHDTSFTAAKKKPLKERQQAEREHATPLFLNCRLMGKVPRERVPKLPDVRRNIGKPEFRESDEENRPPDQTQPQAQDQEG